MPDKTPDERFADLFGKLPGPSAAGQERNRPPTDPAPTQPLSRRALREASQRDAAVRRGVAEREAAARTTPDPVPAAPQPAPRAPQASQPSRPVAESVAPAAPRRAPAGAAPLDALFAGETTADEIGVEPAVVDRDRRKSRIAGWVIAGVIVAIIGGLIGGGVAVWTAYEDRIRAFMGWEEPADFDAGMAEGDVLITIVDGDTGGTISDTLYEAGVTKTPAAFYDYLIRTGQNPPFQPGVFALQRQMTSAAALEAILDPANRREFTAQVPEGLTVAQTLPRLAEATGLPLADFEAAVADPSAYGVEAASLEGWLFPLTYTFDPDVTAAEVIGTMVEHTMNALDAADVPPEDRNEVLTIASIIQREARFSDDFYKVSRVIQNRLDPTNQETFGYLQMDSTAQYGSDQLDDGSASTSAEAQYDDNPWNTYVYTGLPVGPIANVGELAIDAALNPAEGTWLYFVTVNLDTGETIFTDTYAQHQEAILQWDAWCVENPDSGC